MSKHTPIVAVASLIAGTAIAGVAMYMQQNPLAFTSASREPTASAPVGRSTPVYFDEAVEEEAEQSSSPLAFEPMPAARKAATPAPVRKLARTPPPEPVATPAEVELAPEPCKVSDWRAVGFKSTGEPRHVRAICP